MVYVNVIHNATGKAYQLNRNYSLINAEIYNPSVSGFVDYWNGWKSGEVPNWAKDIDEKEFTAYWMF